MDVLLDGGYREEAEGTGISIYSKTLANGLEAIGLRVLWLSGANVSSNADPLAIQASLAENIETLPAYRRYCRTLLRMTMGCLRGTWMARPVLNSGLVVTKDVSLNGRTTLLAPNLFVKAHYRHMLLHSFSTVKTTASVNVLHLTAPLPIKMKGVQNIVTIHDFIPARLPYTTPDNRSEYVRRVRKSIANASLIITVSEASKRDIVEFLEVDPAKVAVTYQSSDLTPLSQSERLYLNRILSKFGLAQDDYCLFVGGLEPKKNIRRLIEAFLETEVSGPLVIVGRRAWMWEHDETWLSTLDTSSLRRIKFLGYLPREDLRWLYAGAQMFVFPSLYEGFGLPLLEAMTSGCPIITSNVASMPEVCGDAAIYVNPWKRDEIRSAIVNLRADPQLRRDLSMRGLIQARKFTFEAYVSQLRSAYNLLPPAGHRGKRKL
jgi:glycosyltransferase involved in cell wall biosynthesis